MPQARQDHVPGLQSQQEGGPPGGRLIEQTAGEQGRADLEHNGRKEQRPAAEEGAGLGLSLLRPARGGQSNRFDEQREQRIGVLVGQDGPGRPDELDVVGGRRRERLGLGLLDPNAQ